MTSVADLALIKEIKMNVELRFGEAEELAILSNTDTPRPDGGESKKRL